MTKNPTDIASPGADEKSMSIRILLVDDHPVVRRGLKALLGSRVEWQVIDEAADGVEAVDKATSLRPDVIVLDVSMPRMDGLEACRIIRKRTPESEILIVTQNDSPQMMKEALSAGARGYVAKSNLARDLMAAIESVSEHRCFAGQDHTPRGDGQ